MSNKANLFITIVNAFELKEVSEEQNVPLKTLLADDELVVASTRHHPARLLKYYPRPECAPSFVKSRILRSPLTHFLLSQQISFILVCIHAGNPRVSPRFLASGPKPCGGKDGKLLSSLSFPV